MSDLLAITYPTEAEAEAVRAKLLGLQREYLIELGDAVVAVKQPDGQVKLNQLFQPVAAGAVSGALGGKMADLGINDNFMKEASAALHSGQAALFLLIRKMTTDKVMAELAGSGGTILRSSFDETQEEALREALAGAQAAVAAAPKA